MIITCIKCGKKNRIASDHTQDGRFRCGACGYEVATFTARKQNPLQVTRDTRKVAVSLFPLLTFAIIASVLLFSHVKRGETLPPAPSDTAPIQLAPSVTPVQSAPYLPKALAETSDNHKDFSLPNGTELTRHRRRQGKGSIHISNGTPSDAVVNLNDIPTDGGPAYNYGKIYVGANCDTTISNIEQGSFTVIFCSGRDWSKSQRNFLKDVQYTKFDDPFSFTENIEYSSGHRTLHFNGYSITLHGVLNGNANTSEASAAEFNAPEKK